MSTDRKALREYYRTCAIGKGVTRQEIKDQNDRLAKTEHRQTVQAILQHWNFQCWAFGVSPVCTRRATDPHELVRRGAGGEVSLANSVASCRACHHEADGKVGGNRLIADWAGKADGLAPNCQDKASIRPIWLKRRRKAA